MSPEEKEMFEKDALLHKLQDYRDKYKTIKVPISEEDIRLFQDLVDGKINNFSWTFDKVNVLFSKEEGDDE